MSPMNILAAKQNPDFVVFGGDLAYSCDGTNVEKVERWFEYFAAWKTNAVAPDGRLIPMLVTLGNHEVVGSYHQPANKAAGFHDVFSMPGERGYDCLDFGNYLSLFLLNSDHTAAIEGAQSEWLASQLAARRRVPHVFPVYHTPGYPAHREFTGNSAIQAIRVRAHWSPLFEKFGVKLAFENHDHVFKRTHPIRANQVDPSGTVYLGDGAWGVELRKPTEQPRWYLASAGSIRHFFVVTLYKEARHVLAMDDTGKVFDEVYQRVK
jgi:acid phosphatase type 7